MFSPKYKSVLSYAHTLKKHPALVFALLALTFGCMYIFSLAPLSGTDEFTHFARVYQITQGTFWEQKMPDGQYGGYLPSNVNQMINDYRNLSRESGGSQFLSDTRKLNQQYSSISSVGQKRQAATFNSVLAYPPWAYPASILGVLSANLLHLPLIWYVYLGRLFSLLAWILLSLIAIKYIPGGKWFLVCVALLPTSLTQAATISADGLVNGLSWLVISITLAILAGKVSINFKILIFLACAMVYLSLIKQSYWVVALFPFIIPTNLFKTRLQAIVWRSSTATSIMALVAWFSLDGARKVSTTVLAPVAGANINSKQQIHYLLHHLITFAVRVTWLPFTKSFDTIYLGIVGIYSNRLIYLSIPIIGLLFVGLYINLKNIRPIPELSIYRFRLTFVSLAIIFCTYALIATSFYISETSVGASGINSIYGRYFLPLLPMLVLFPMVYRQKYYPDGSLVVIASMTINVIALISTIVGIQ